MSLQPERCLLAYRSTYNAYFMDLPVSFFVCHFLGGTKSVVPSYLIIEILVICFVIKEA